VRGVVRTDSWNTAIKRASNTPFSIRETIHRAADNSAMERDVRVVGNKRSRI
jgi:hypothetical protein